jgi:hypothetical protein
MNHSRRKPIAIANVAKHRRCWRILMNMKKLALIGICDACGDDDAFSEDVIQL